MKIIYLLLLTIISSALPSYTANEGEKLKPVPPFIQGLPMNKREYNTLYHGSPIFITSQGNMHYPILKEHIKEDPLFRFAPDRIIRDLQELSIVCFVRLYQIQHRNSHKKNERGKKIIPTKKTKRIKKDFEQITKETCLENFSLKGQAPKHILHQQLSETYFIHERDLGEQIELFNKNIEYNKPEIILKPAKQLE